MTALPNPNAPADPAAPSLMIDLRPCYEGYAGIPQEFRLLFSMFSGFGLRRFGALASGVHFTSRRMRHDGSPFQTVLAQTLNLIAQDTRRSQLGFPLRFMGGKLAHRLFRHYLVVTEAFRREKLDQKIDPVIFEDFLWMKLFDNTLPAAKRNIVPKAEYFATELGHEYARSLSLLPRFVQRRIDSAGWDIFFAGTPSPYRLHRRTKAIIRYYDALPLLSPHTVGEPWMHAISHARTLLRNMQDDATFVCDSEPVREDLLRLFPKAERRVHTIPVVLSGQYFPDPRPEAEIIPLLKRRASAETQPTRPLKPVKQLPRLIMAVSTLEPRKNYLKLFRGFETARRRTKTAAQLVIVANQGWRSDAETRELKALVKEGAFHLAGVPTIELRLLYSSAHCVVAPSRAEGFDYSGVEAMACGTPLLASDIPVHRWVYGDAAVYFDPYDEDGLATLLTRVIELPREEGELAAMTERGLRQARLFTAETLAPRWETLIRETGRDGWA